jgi:hypothetical protein
MTHGIQKPSDPLAWPEALKIARSRVKRLAEAVRGFPRPLPELARFQRVEQVVFRKLAVDGCIKATDGGFIIYANKLEYEPEVLNQWYEEESLGRARLPARMRFTLAHELAHTLFYSHGEDRPRSLIGYRRAEQRSRLEVACNNFASQLLLPTDEVARFAAHSDFWMPDIFRSYAKRAGVSDPALAFRMKPYLGRVGIALIDFADDEKATKVPYTCIGEGLLDRSLQINHAFFAASLLASFKREVDINKSTGKSFNAKCQNNSILRGSRVALWNCWLERCYDSRWLFTFRLEDQI